MKTQLYILFLLSFVGLEAQNSISLYHLGNATFQSNYLNPSYIPKEKIFLGIPIISGVHLSINNKLSYNEMITEEINSRYLDISNNLDKFQRNNMISAHLNANLFHFGFKTSNNKLISLSVRERVEIDILYPKQFLSVLYNSTLYTNQNILLSKAGLKGSHFREYGFGYASAKNKFLTIGFRAKLLVGFNDVSLPANFAANLVLNDEYFQIENTTLKNFRLQSSGIDSYQDYKDDLINNIYNDKNYGVGFDLGMSYDLNYKNSISASLLDIGFIRWDKTNQNAVVESSSSLDFYGININENDTQLDDISFYNDFYEIFF